MLRAARIRPVNVPCRERVALAGSRPRRRAAEYRRAESSNSCSGMYLRIGIIRIAVVRNIAGRSGAGLKRFGELAEAVPVFVLEERLYATIPRLDCLVQ